jgi:hypothetical protein
MVAQQLPLVAPAHNNRQLFSDHYLDHTLPRHGDWQLLAATVAPLMAQIAALYAAFTPSNIEAQTERDLVQPILAALGHTFEVQAALRTPDGTKKPDYVFYRDRAALDANKDATLTEERLRSGGLAVGDAKYWDRPLDVTIKATGDDPFTNGAPSPTGNGDGSTTATVPTGSTASTRWTSPPCWRTTTPPASSTSPPSLGARPSRMARSAWPRS